VDDSLDVFSCHGMAGISGALLTGVFASKLANPAGADGLLHGNAAQLGVQALAVVAAIVFAAAGTVGILWLVKVTLGLRADVHDEITGLDVSEHGEEAYFGGELGSFAGPGVSLGGSVVVTPVTVPLPGPAPATN
jgi:Amt family ammonium transporter